MKHSIKSIICIVVTMMFMSCHSNSQISQIELVANSPSGCTHIFYLKNNGEGTFIAGAKSDDDISEIEEVIYKGTFTIADDKVEKVLTKINEIGTDAVKTERAKDVMEYILKVDGKQRVLSYGRKSEVINDLKDLITSSTSASIDFFCESYVSSSKN